MSLTKLIRIFDSSTAHNFSNGNNDYSYIVNTLSADLNLPFTWLNFELGGKYSHFRTNNVSEFGSRNGFYIKKR